MPDPQRAVSLRAILLGLLGVILTCAITPYNNFVANNTFLVGNLMPVAAVLNLALAVVLINAPLRRWLPRHAFTPGELTVAFAMMLVSCTLPSSGLMRYLPASLVSPFWIADTTPAYREILRASVPMDWLFPTFGEQDIIARGSDPITRMFIERNVDESGFRAVPWSAWITPAISWGIFLLLFYTAIICLVALVRRQWAENERIRFPLAEVYGSLLEEPNPGRSVPPLLRSVSFWCTAGAIFALHLSNGIARYIPEWPAVELKFNITPLLSESPWIFTTYGLKSATLMFTVVGVCYFVPIKVLFSLVAFFFVFNAYQVITGPSTGGVSLEAQRDQTMGAILVFAATLFYTGRRHWWMILRSMVGLRSSDPDDAGRDLPNAVAAWTFVVSIVGMTVWLKLAGSSVPNALAILTVLMLMYLVLARIVAETGLIYVQSHALAHRPWVFAMELPEGIATRTTATGTYLMAQITHVLATDMRESAMTYAQHGLATADRVENVRPMRGRRWGLPLCMLLALVVGYITAGGSTLLSYYNYYGTTDQSDLSPINPWGTIGAVEGNVLNLTRQLDSPSAGFSPTHNGWMHLGIGAVAGAVVSVLHLTYAGFPLHPIGVVMAYSFPLQHIWFSVMIGWMLKSALTRFGGASVLRNVRPFFLGLVFGETAAIAAWIVINLIISATGHAHVAINILLP